MASPPELERVSAGQQFWIDERAIYEIMEIRQMRTDAAQVNEVINRPEQTIVRDVILKRDLAERRRLLNLLRSHHRQFLRRGRIVSATCAAIQEEFFNKVRTTRQISVSWHRKAFWVGETALGCS